MKVAIKKSFVVIAILTLILVSGIGVIKANAETIQEVKTLELSQKDGVLTASGTTVEGILAVAVMVYDENGTKLVAMQTTDVDNSCKFSTQIKLDTGNYVVRAANYDGGKNIEKKVSIKSPNTGDSNEIILFSVTMMLALAGTAMAVKCKKN